MGKGSSKFPEQLEDLIQDPSIYFTKEELETWYKGFAKDCPKGRLGKKEFQALYYKLFPYGDATKFSEHVFRAFDSNSDGQIDFREFICVMSIAQRGTAEDKLRWAFQLYDLDSDGCITRGEMLEIIKAIYKLGKTVVSDNVPPERKTQEIFEMMDANHDGVVTQDEFIQVGLSDPAIGRLLRLATLTT